MINKVKGKLNGDNSHNDAIVLNTTIATLRDCSVAWVLNAHKEISNPELVKKVSFAIPLRL